MCEGTIETILCSSGKPMCPGGFDEIELNGGDNPVCICNAGTFEFNINPKIPGVTYIWEVEGDLSINVTGEGKADITANGQGTVRLIITNPCGESKTIEKTVYLGAPPKPEMILFQAGQFYPCIEVGHDKSFPFVDKNKIWDPICPIEYDYELTGNIDRVIVQKNKANKDIIQFIPGTSDIGKSACFRITATNQCGSSVSDWYCVEVKASGDCNVTYPTIENPLDIETNSININLIGISPNPSNNEVKIENKANTPTDIDIYSVDGRMVYSNITIPGLNHIIVPNLSTGTYFLISEYGSRKFIVE